MRKTILIRSSIFTGIIAAATILVVQGFFDIPTAATAVVSPGTATIRSVAPGRFLERGSGTFNITIRGTHFRPGVRVYVGSVRASVVQRYGTTTLRATVDRSSFREGRYSVVVRNADGIGSRRSQAVRIVAPHVAAAGDIAVCGNGETNDEATAALLDGFDGTVMTLGDNAYPSGTSGNFSECYDPTWGRHRARTLPVPGNHDYATSGASGYFGYFGAKAGDSSRGYYRQTIADWQILVVNSNCGEVGGCAAGSPQAEWLESELQAAPACTIVAMHHPRFSTALHGDNASMDDIWRLLVAYHVDVVLAGHDHAYQRFAPMNASGQLAADGPRLFVVGTGGYSLYNFPTSNAALELRDNTSHGILDLTLHRASFAWEFKPIAGQVFSDSGSSDCW